jgi:hypothetical protein
MLSCSPIFHVKFLALVQGIFSIGTRYPRNSWETLTVLYTLQKLSSYYLVPPPPPPKVSPCSLVPSAYMFPCFSSIISLCSLVPPKVSPCSIVPHPKVSHVPLFLQLTCSLFPYKLFRFVPLVVPTLQNMPCSLETSWRASLLSYEECIVCGKRCYSEHGNLGSPDCNLSHWFFRILYFGNFTLIWNLYMNKTRKNSKI